MSIFTLDLSVVAACSAGWPGGIAGRVTTWIIGAWAEIGLCHQSGKITVTNTQVEGHVHRPAASENGSVAHARGGGINTAGNGPALLR
jgi:hypothetical protein